MEELITDPQPKRRGRPPKAAAEPAAVLSGDVSVTITRAAVHDGKGGKFYAGDVVTVPADVAEAWLELGWAERA